MKRLTSVALAGVLAVATVATTFGSADAAWRGRYYGGYRGGCVGCGFAAGAVTGLALGAIATAPYGPYYRPYYRPYYAAPAYYYGPPPPPPRYYAANAHVNWCLANYRSYNPATNTFVGYDGYAHICVGPY